jgi:hypothetical protein
MESPDDIFDKKLMAMIEKDGNDPTATILAARPTPALPTAQTQTGTAEPVVTADSDLREPTSEEKIQRDAALVTVDKQHAIDWSRNAACIGDAFDRLNVTLFSLLAGAEGDERYDFAMDERDMDSFVNAMEPVAQKRNWQLGPEWALGITMTDILLRNVKHALSLRKAKEREKALQAENEALKAENAAIKKGPHLQVNREE